LISAHIGNQHGPDGRKSKEYIGNVEVIIDGKLFETVKFPADFLTRKLELFWNYDLAPGNHYIELKLQNPSKEDPIVLNYAIVYKSSS
jgi:hypothetical protein